MACMVVLRGNFVLLSGISYSAGLLLDFRVDGAHAILMSS